MEFYKPVKVGEPDFSSRRIIKLMLETQEKLKQNYYAGEYASYERFRDQAQVGSWRVTLRVQRYLQKAPWE